METVAKGLEYALADDCVAKVARLLGKRRMRSISQNVPDLRQSSTRRPVLCVASVPTASSANRLILSQPFIVRMIIPREMHGDLAWLVPHDVHGLVKLFGNEQKFVTKLDSLFIVTGNMGDNASPDISGLIGQYAHGNEPVIRYSICIIM